MGYERERLAEMKAFWLPSKTPETDAKVEKPDTETRCPMRASKLGTKDLTDVKWATTGTDSRPICPLCRSFFSNSSHIVVLKPTGDAIDEECYKRIVKPEGSYNGKRIRSRDVIKLERPGTGFAAGGGPVESQQYSSVGPHLSVQDTRGHPGPDSRFGLQW